MTNFLSRLFMPGEQAALGRWASWLGVGEVDDDASPAGVNLTRESSTAITAVYACVRVITGTVSTLPIDILQRNGPMRTEVAPPGWLNRPVPDNPNITRVSHFSHVVSSMLFDGGAATLVMPSVFDPQELHNLDTRVMEIRKENGRRVYRFRGNGQVRDFTDDNLIYTPLPFFLGADERGLAPIEAARQGMSLSLAAERYGAKFYENGTILSGLIKTDARLSQQAQDELRDAWAKRYGGVKNAHKPGVLTGGADWKPLGITPEQSQFIEVRRYQAEDMARLYGVPPSIIGITIPGAVSYASVEQQNLQFVTYTLRNIVESIEASYARLVPGQTLKFNMRSLLRGDSVSRATYYRELANIGVYTQDDIRALEDYPPIRGGSVPRVQLNTGSPSSVDANTQANAYKALRDAGYPPQLAARVTGLPDPGDANAPA